MFDKYSWLLIDKAHAQWGGLGNALNNNIGFFGIFRINDPGQVNAQSKFSNVVSFIIGWVLAIVAIIAFIYLILNGVKYITAGGDAAKATEARNGIINAIIGIIVVVIAFTILRFAAGLGSSINTV